MDAPRDQQPHSERFVHPAYRPGRSSAMPPAPVFTVEVLLLFAVVVFLAAPDSVWGPVIGTVLLIGSVIVALCYRVSLRSIFRGPPGDDRRKLHNRRNA
jgi:hypothetical protein